MCCILFVGKRVSSDVMALLRKKIGGIEIGQTILEEYVGIFFGISYSFYYILGLFLQM